MSDKTIKIDVLKCLYEGIRPTEEEMKIINDSIRENVRFEIDGDRLFHVTTVKFDITEPLPLSEICK